MPTGRPMTLKCPRCRCGQHGKPDAVRGIALLADVRRRRLYTAGRRGGRVTLQRAVHCRDCGHSWWTTHFDGELKLEALLDKEKQLRLPGTGTPGPVAL